MAYQQLVLVDVVLKELELHSACVDPSVNLREDLAIAVHTAACRLADVCHPQIMDYQAVARQQLFDKLQVPKRLGSICRILLQHKQLRTLGGTLLGPLISLGTRTSPTARASNLDIMFSTQVAKSGLLAEIPGIIDTAVQKLEAGKAGTPVRVEVIVPNSLARRRGGAGSHKNGSSSGAVSSSGSATGVSGNCSNHQLNSIAAGQHEAAFLGLVSNLLQLVECLNTVWPGNLLQSPDTGPVFVPATQLVVSCISYANYQLTQLAEKDQLPSASLFRALYSAVRLCPTLCSVLARHGTRVSTTVQILPVASALMGAPSFRQCALLYTALQAQIQMVAPQHGWLSTAETAYAQQSGRNSASSRNSGGRSGQRRSSAAAAAAGSSSSAGSSGGNRRRTQQGRSAAAPGNDAPIEGLALEAWRMACEQQQPVLLPAHEQLLDLLGASRKLLLWLGMLICIDSSQPSLQHAVLQQTLLVEVLDVYRSCWQLQPGMEPPGRLEVEQLQVLPCMLLQWANTLQMATDSEDYVFCAMGAAFSSRFALRTWMVHRFFHPVAVPAAPDQQLLDGTAGQAAVTAPPPPAAPAAAAAAAAAAAVQQQQQQEQEVAAPEDDLPDDECFDELVPVAVQLMQRLLRQVQSGTQLVPSTTLAPMADPASGPDGSTWGLPARTAAEALKQTLEVLNWVASTNPAMTANWISNSPKICAVLEAYGRCESAGPARLRAQVLLGALRGMYVHDVIPRGSSSFLLSAVVLQRCMTAGVGSVEQTQLHSMLVTGLKLSSSLLPDQQFAYLELVSSISAAAQAVLCTLYEDAVAAGKTDPAAASAAASAMLPWLFLLGRCAKYIALLVEQLLQCKLDQEALWPGSNPARFAPAGGPGATRSLGLWLYMTAGCLCMRLLHLTLTLLSPLAVDRPEGTQEGQGQGVSQGRVVEGLTDRERRVEQQQKQQQQYLLQLSSCRSGGQQQQQQQQTAQAQDAVQQGVDQGLAAAAAADGCKDEAVQQQQQQQQLDGEQQQDQERLLQPVQDSKHSEQQQQQQQQAADDSASISLRQMVWKAANDCGTDVSAISEQLLRAYTAVSGADAALQRHFDQAVLMQLAQPAGEEAPIDPAAIRAANLFGHAPVMAVAAAPAAPVSSSSNSSSAAAGGPAAGAPAAATAAGAAAGAAASSSGGGGGKGSRGSGNVLQAVAEAGEVSPEACAAFAEDAAVVAMVPALHAASTALSTLPIILACNNPGCMNMDKESEQQMVNGRGCMCGGCKVARYCGKPCQNAHWKIHRPVCKAVVKMGAAEAAPAAAPVAAAAGAASVPAVASASASAS